MASAGATITGQRKLDRKLRRLDRKVQRKFQRRALRAAAKIVHADAKARAPKRSGIMARQLKVRTGRTRRGQASVLVRTGTRKEMGNIPNTPKGGYYPAHVELGTKKRPAKPFLRPALAAKRDEAIMAYRQSLWNDIRSEAAKP